MNIIFQIDGGIGKNVAATAVCKAIKTQYPNDKLIVITGYPEVFLCSPYVDKALNFNNLNYFYSDNIEGQQVKMMLHNPYMESDFVNQIGHLNKVWCEMFGIKYNNEQPELHLNNRELQFFGNQISAPKPIMVLQTNGGAQNQPNKYSWTRDLPIATAQKVVNHFVKDYTIVHIRREDQPALQNTISVHNEFRAIATLINMSTKRLFIDSFCQHTAASLNKPSVVCWIGNIPSQFGYDIHTNIIANPPTMKPELRNSVFSKYNISGQPTEFCYNSEDEIFDADRIIEALQTDVSPLQNISAIPDLQLNIEEEKTKQNGSSKKLKPETA